jgi:hypothetical protein
MNKSDITIDKLREALDRLEYVFFEDGDYNLNTIGIRTEDKSSNRFNDYIAVAYKINNQWQLDIFNVTTDPGTYWLNHPVNVKGTAILSAGQHRGCYKLGKHQGIYKALTQAKPVPVYRDRNLNSSVDDHGTLDVGFHGINIHRANSRRKSTQVDKWSAGCQVFADPNDYVQFIKLCEETVKRYGENITYTLINERDLK